MAGIGDEIKQRYDTFMRGRTGLDTLGLMLLILAAVLAVLGVLFDFQALSVIALFPLGYAVVRMLSRDTAKRAQEQREYVDMVNRADKRARLAKLKWKNRKTTAYFTCKTCGATLAVPKGKGKIRVTCPKCHATEVHES